MCLSDLLSLASPILLTCRSENREDVHHHLLNDLVVAHLEDELGGRARQSHEAPSSFVPHPVTPVEFELRTWSMQEERALSCPVGVDEHHVGVPLCQAVHVLLPLEEDGVCLKTLFLNWSNQGIPDYILAFPPLPPPGSCPQTSLT